MSEIIRDLVDIGLTEYEAKVYSAMIHHSLLTASDITKIGDVPRGRVYDIINQLIEKGFCVTVPGGVKKFKAVDPETAIRNLIEQQKKKEQKMLRVAEYLKSQYNSNTENTAPMDYIQVLTSKQSQLRKFQQLMKNSKEISRVFIKKPYATNPDKEDIEEISDPLKKILNSGITIKSIYEGDDQTQHFIEWVRHFESIGEQIRIGDTLPMKMLISDNHTAMISLRNEGTSKFNLLSMVVEHSDLTTALIELFEHYWNNSMTIEEYLESRNLKRPY